MFCAIHAPFSRLLLPLPHRHRRRLHQRQQLPLWLRRRPQRPPQRRRKLRRLARPRPAIEPFCGCGPRPAVPPGVGCSGRSSDPEGGYESRVLVFEPSEPLLFEVRSLAKKLGIDLNTVKGTGRATARRRRNSEQRSSDAGANGRVLEEEPCRGPQ